MRKEEITLGAAKLSLEKPMLSLGSKVCYAWKKMQPPLRELQGALYSQRNARRLRDGGGGHSGKSSWMWGLVYKATWVLKNIVQWDEKE